MQFVVQLILNAKSEMLIFSFWGNFILPLIQGETKLEKVNGLPRFARLKKVFAK